MFNFIYIAHSKERIRKAAKFSILTLLSYSTKFKFDFRVVVYTDKPSYFSQLGNKVKTEDLDDINLDVWYGPNKSEVRVKFETIADAFETYDGHIIYLDSETIFKENPARIVELMKKGVSVSSELYDSIPAVKGKEFNGSLKKLSGVTIGNKEVDFAKKTELLNTSLLTFNQEDAKIVKSVLKAFKKIKENDSGLAEEYILSAAVSQTLKVLTTDMVFSWASRNKNVKRLLKTFFEQRHHDNIEVLINESIEFSPKILKVRTNHERNFMEKVRDLMSTEE